MELIKMQDGLPIFVPEARTIKAFKKIIVRARKNSSWEKQRDRATLELAYVWFMEDFKSYYTSKYPKDEVERDAQVRKRLGLEDWKALKDNDIIEAREVYREMSDSIELWMLRTARIAAIDLIRRLERDVSPPKTDGKFKLPKRPPEEIIKQLKEVSIVLDTLNELEKAAKRSSGSGKMYGNKSKNVFEDPPEEQSR